MAEVVERERDAEVRVTSAAGLAAENEALRRELRSFLEESLRSAKMPTLAVLELSRGTTILVV